MYFKTRLSILFFVLFLVQASDAQFDVKLGYEGLYQNFEKSNELFEAYNSQNEWLSNEFNSLHSLHGLSIGLRYKLSRYFGIEAAYSNKWTERSASGLNPDSGIDDYLKIGHRDVHYSFGLEVFIVEQFSFGGNLSYNQFNADATVDSDGDASRLFRAEGTASQFFLSYNIPTNSITKICLRPFLQTYWHTPIIDELNKELNSPINKNDLDESLLGFGISLVFYNGNSTW